MRDHGKIGVIGVGMVGSCFVRGIVAHVDRLADLQSRKRLSATSSHWPQPHFSTRKNS